MEILIGVGVLGIVIIAIAGFTNWLDLWDFTGSSPPETDGDAQVLSRLKAEIRSGTVSKELQPILDAATALQAKGFSKNEAFNIAVARYREDIDWTATAMRRINESLVRSRDFDPGPTADAVITEVAHGIDIFKALHAAMPGATMGQIAAVSAEIKQRELHGAALPDAIRSAISNFSSRQ